ncbi:MULTISPECIES: hypothetical protein [Shewanella]|nr:MULTISPECIES: hypothetical protein [Shewanella]
MLKKVMRQVKHHRQFILFIGLMRGPVDLSGLIFVQSHRVMLKA